MDTTAEWHQDVLVKPVEEAAVVITNKSASSGERKMKEQSAVNCPRCNSTNTKFCYYNNYSLSQPRFFCKTCRRYWTQGGSLRNIPVGGGSRKNKRPSTNSISNPSKKLPELLPSPVPQQNPKTTQDLNLGVYSNAAHQQFIYQLPNYNKGEFQTNNPSSSSSPSFIQVNNDPTNTSTSHVSSSTVVPEFQPSLNFSLDGLGSNYGSFQGVQESSGKHLLFPFEDLNQVPPPSNKNNNKASDDNNGQQNNGGPDSTGYWSGLIGGGSW